MMGNGFGFGLSGLGMILFWAAIIALVVWLVRSFVGRGSAADPSERKSAREILEERYARGEIDRDELELRRRDLSA